MKNKQNLIIIFLFLTGIIFLIWGYFSGFELKKFFSDSGYSIEIKILIVSILFLFRNYLFIPSTILILLAGYILQDFYLTLIISIIGVSIGILQTYYVGKTFGKNLEKSKKIGTIRRYQKKIKKNGFKAIFICSLIPLIPVDLIYYAAAMTNYDIRKFFLAGILGELPLIILYSYFGKEATKYFPYIILFFIIIGIIYFGYIYLKKT